MKKIYKILSLSLLVLSIAGCNSNNSNSSDHISSSDEPSIDSSDVTSSNETSKESISTSEPSSSKPSTNKPSSSEDLPTSEPSSSNQETSQEDSSSQETNKPLNEYGLLENPQDGVILHAWNWSMKEIKSHLKEIAEAGYSTIQTSPMQPQKDYYPHSTYQSQWWKLYQPLGFSIATKEHSLGTKNELKDLCDEADKYGINIIVDVVSNHLAGGNKKAFHNKVKEYEPDIYNQKLFHTSFDHFTDLDGESVVKASIGDFPDLKTEDKVVQERVLSLLNEYIDVGVDGFRFDAAKHIETPSDKDYGSSYWTTILDGSTEHARSLNKPDPYFYGEILNTTGKGRSFEYYTKMMSVTDNLASKDTLDAVRKKKLNKIDTKSIYNETLTPEQVILWGESHDTFANNDGDSKNTSQKDVNKAYAINASRKDASTLYFARPKSSSKVGEMGSLDWKNKEITAINKFHNNLVNAKETITSNDGYFINIRESEKLSGVALINVDGSNKLNIHVEGIKDGTYVDQVTNKNLVVKNGILTGTADESGIVVFYTSKLMSRPTISINLNEEILYEAKTLKIDVSNATSAYYQIDNQEKVPFLNSTSINLFEGIKEGCINIKVVAENDETTITRNYKFTKANRSNLTITCKISNSSFIENKNVFAWVWEEGKQGRFVEGKLNKDTFTFTYKENENCFLLVTTNKDVTFDKMNWDKKIKQTKDLKIENSQEFVIDESSWK